MATPAGCLTEAEPTSLLPVAEQPSSLASVPDDPASLASAADEPTGLASAAACPASLASFPGDLLLLILRRISETSQGYSHALVCREWADLALEAQVACAGTCRLRGEHLEELAAGVEASQPSLGLSLFPNLTSVSIRNIAPTKLPRSFLCSISESLQHLSVKGEDEGEIWVDEESGSQGSFSFFRGREDWGGLSFSFRHPESLEGDEASAEDVEQFLNRCRGGEWGGVMEEDEEWDGDTGHDEQATRAYLQLFRHGAPEDEEGEGNAPLLEGLPRFRSLETLSILNHVIPRGAWPHSASLRHLDLGGNGEFLTYQSFEHRRRFPVACPTHRKVYGVAGVSIAFLRHLSELRELRVLRAKLCEGIEQLPESLSRLTNLEELNVWGGGLQAVFSGIGECQKLKHLLIGNGGFWLALPPSLSQLGSLSFIYLGVQSFISRDGDDVDEYPFDSLVLPCLGALCSLRTTELGPFCYLDQWEADTLLRVPSLQRLHTSRLPGSMTMYTSLQELCLQQAQCSHWGHLRPEYEGEARRDERARRYPRSLWQLRSLRVLSLQGLGLYEIPEAVRGLSSLEELRAVECVHLRKLPDALAELPRLRRVILVGTTRLRSLPSIGSWPALQTLHLQHLPNLRVPEGVLRQLRQGKGLRLMDVPHLEGMGVALVPEDEGWGEFAGASVARVSMIPGLDEAVHLAKRPCPTTAPAIHSGFTAVARSASSAANGSAATPMADLSDISMDDPAPAAIGAQAGGNTLLDLSPAPPPPGPSSIVAFEGKGLSVSLSFPKDPSNAQATTILATFRNSSPQVFTDFVLQAAMPKVMQLQLETASSSVVPANGDGTVSQAIRVINTKQGEQDMAMLLRISYKVAGQDVLLLTKVSNFPAGL